MRSVLLLSLVLAFPGVAAAQGGAGDKPPAPADADRRMTEDIEIMRRLVQRSIDNAVGLVSFQGLHLRTNLNPYVTNLGPGTLTVIDTRTHRVSSTISIGPYGTDPFTVVTTGDAVYVANQGANTLSVIDPSTLKVTATVATGNSPYGIAVVQPRP